MTRLHTYSKSTSRVIPCKASGVINNFKQIMQHAKDEDFCPVNNKDMAIYTWINKTPCLEFCKIMFLKSNDGFIFKSMLNTLVSATDEARTHIHFLTDEAGYIMFATDEAELFCFYDLICISRLIDAWNPSISSMMTLLFSIDCLHLLCLEDRSHGLDNDDDRFEAV